MRKLLLSTAFLATMTAGSAFAVPITTNPGNLVANGDVNAVFAYVDAGDRSQLLRFNVAGVIFDNQVDAAGTTRNVGVNSGPIQFQLFNTSQNYSFINDVADTGPGGDGYFHAKYGTTAADFGVTFSAATNTALANLAANGPIILIGYEDRRENNNSDFDYNDLIFAFSAVRSAVDVPEPASIALLGLGLLGMSALRRRAS